MPSYKVRVRTPDDPRGWTAQGEVPIGEDYLYSSGDVAVEIRFPKADHCGVCGAKTDTRPKYPSGVVRPSTNYGAELETMASRVLTRPDTSERLYEMPDGRLLTVRGEGWASNEMMVPVSVADAEDFWGYTQSRKRRRRA